MKQAESIDNSLVDQITEDMLSRLMKLDGFDEQVIEKLRKLAASGKLRNVEAVIKALGSASKNLS